MSTATNRPTPIGAYGEGEALVVVANAGGVLYRAHLPHQWFSRTTPTSDTVDRVPIEELF